MNTKIVYLFGSQALSLTHEDVAKLRTTVTETSALQWITETVAELPIIAEEYSRTSGNALPAKVLADVQSLHQFFTTDMPISNFSPALPNVILSPLVIIGHLIEYTLLMDSATVVHEHQGEAFGLCTGMLSAFAVAANKGQESLAKYGAVALRLAVLIGVVVDATEDPDAAGPSKSFASAWAGSLTHNDIVQLVNSFPDAYVAVTYDECRATITASAGNAEEVQTKLQDAGVTTTELGFHGRFHWPGHTAMAESVLAFCRDQARYHFADIDDLNFSTRSNQRGAILSSQRLHEVAIQSLLTLQPQWSDVFAEAMDSSSFHEDALMIMFGPERCMPPSLTSRVRKQLKQAADLLVQAESAHSTPEYRVPHKDDDIAIIGMSCKVPGAEDLEEFWDILCKGQSQHREVPTDRFDFEIPFRPKDSNRKWFGNFINDYDTFDHRFFKKSPREASSTDPQQRQLLQSAYQAVQQSGYFRNHTPDTNVGCYVGVCSVDYENNIACHQPNAYSSIGNLRGFIAGKVSHHFGWTGPGLTIDTACSSSAVAIHQACQAILNGECNAALAGGTHVMTSPLWFQNLAAASFLSPTGSCKPFDAAADGYCRGEGVATVFLKRMSSAIADGDTIFATIAGTAVQQNNNCTPIFVPNSPSLSDLFRKVTSRAQLSAEQITVVEAHGTGTPVGDPVEYDSVRDVLGSSKRTSDIALSSVKGLIGHLECTSGVVSLIKIVLMMLKGSIPPQASFKSMSPAIKTLPTDHIRIPTAVVPWRAEFKAALINNYGASGSNASIVVKEAGFRRSDSVLSIDHRYPFCFSALDHKSLARYLARFRSFLSSLRLDRTGDILRSISFNLLREYNQALPEHLIFTANSISNLDDQLRKYKQESPTSSSMPIGASRPVIFCFGGQSSTFVGLSEKLYRRSSLLRKHLEICDAACTSLGVRSIFPHIFKRTSIDDLALLHSMLFSLQYSCAQAWIASGVVPTAMVGHSFGELTALCVSGALSLRDCLQAIIGRARVIENSWGSDTGAMMAVEGDLSQIEELLRQSNKVSDSDHPATIACFNGVRQFTLAGPQSAIDRISNTMSNSTTYSSLRTKMLKVTHAYHSVLASPLMDAVEQSAKEIRFEHPRIPLERTTESSSDAPLSPRFFAEHMRSPVYFRHAVQRLKIKYPSAVWLEAGSSSSVTLLAQRAIPDAIGHTFHELNITSEKALDNLTETTASLWRAGVSATFWLHHSLHAQEHAPLILPPYQFEKSRHWMEQKKANAPLPAGDLEAQALQRKPDTLLSLISSDKQGLRVRFSINTSIAAYEELLSGHKIAHTAPICPATAQLDFAIEAVRCLNRATPVTDFLPELRDIRNLAPVCRDLTRSLWLDLEGKAGKTSWSFKITSIGSESSDSIIHTTGGLVLLDIHNSTNKLNFARYERLKMHKRCLDILDNPNSDEVIQGRNIYRAFSDVVDYGPHYRGLQKLVGHREESAGKVLQAYNSKTWLDPLLSDVFCQVAGIFVNCMSDRGPEDMYLACEIENWMRSPELQRSTSPPDFYHVLATHSKAPPDGVTSDVFVFDGVTGSLVEIILGIKYRSVKKTSMQRILTRMTPGLAADIVGTAAVRIQKSELDAIESQPRRPKLKASRKAVSRGPDILGQIKAILSLFLGLDHKDILEISDLADLGVDSLMAIEMITEIERKLNCNLPLEEIASVTTISGLVKCVSSSLSGGDDTKLCMSDDSSDTDISASLPPTTTTTPEDRQVDITCHLAQFLGLEDGTIKPSTVLRDLGVDSLLSIELRADLSSVFGTHLAMDVCLEDMTISELNQALGGSALPGPQVVSQIFSSSSSIPYAPVANTDLDLKNCESPPLYLPLDTIREAFAETKRQTDDQFAIFGCHDYSAKVLPQKTELCIALIVEALEHLGCHIRTAKEGALLPLVVCREEQKHLRDYLYKALAEGAGVVLIEGETVRRGVGVLSLEHSETILARAVQTSPREKGAFRLIYYAGSHLADVLSGKTDGVKLIFGNTQGRELVSSLYGEWPINRLMYRQIEDFLSKLSDKLPSSHGTLRIIEIGAGTGGTSQWLIPLLAKLPIRVEYTFTDLAPSFVAAARKRFSQYDWIRYRIHDIEKPAPEELRRSQHIVIASNAIHATHNIIQSASHVREFLRADGLLMMVEMTTPLLWADVIFGLFEGWWFFHDGRTHAVMNEVDWKRRLLAAGYGSVDWTDGQRPENKLEKLIIATATAYSSLTEQAPTAPDELLGSDTSPPEKRATTVERYVQRMTSRFRVPSSTSSTSTQTKRTKPPTGICVLLTGGSGSLGAHLVSNLVERDDVRAVICVNRPHKGDAHAHQLKALISRGILVSAQGLAKLQTFEGDMTQAMLGLPEKTYQYLLDNITCIMHNAWTMSAKRPIAGFEAQFDILGNLLSMASDVAALRPREWKTRFIFVSSIAVVGRYPLWKGTPHVPEERMPIEAVLSNGYGDAKWACELALDRTLHKYSDNFATSSVRIGQIAGSRKSGYWNPMEHTSFLWKSSQTVNAIPNLQGLLSWTPVDDVAGTLGDLIDISNPHPVYNIDNPIRQPWSEMIPVLAKALGIPQGSIIPFDDWVTRVRQCEEVGQKANPAAMLVDFLEENFQRMSCGGLLLATQNTREHSETLRKVQPVSEEVARRFVQAWKDMRFLS